MRRSISTSLWSLFLAVLLMLPSCKNPVTEVIEIDCQELIISPISNQVVFGATRTYIPISVLGKTLDNVEFKIAEGERYVSINNTQRGRALLIIDASQTDIGTYDITIDVNNNDDQNACISFKLEIKGRLQGRLIHCDPNQDEDGNNLPLYHIFPDHIQD